MRQMISMTFALVFVLGLAGFAQAEDAQRFKPARDAIEASGLKVLKAEPGKDFRGNPALLLSAEKSMDQVVKHFRELYRSQKQIGDATVVGMAHVVHSDTWNVTLRVKRTNYTFKVARQDKGSRLTIREPLRAARKPATK